MSFRFSVQAADTDSRRSWRDLAQRVEGAGYDLLVTADHLDSGCLSPFPPLIAAAEAAPSLRVGTLVINNDLRHPSLLAREAATIDLLTDGRLELGIGAGHAWTEYQRNGLRFDPAATRVDRLDESVQVLRRLLHGEEVTFAGAHYQLDGERCYPGPTGGHVPLLVGGGGNRVLAIAARRADTVGFTGLGRSLEGDPNFHEASGFAPIAVDAQVGRVRDRAAHRPVMPELQALVQAVVVTDRPEAAAEKLRASGPLSSLSAEKILASPYLMVGTVDSLTEKVLADRERWGFSHYTVRAPAVDAFAPVVAALAGR
jgi:probable F420-dependent oxidoreductase